MVGDEGKSLGTSSRECPGGDLGGYSDRDGDGEEGKVVHQRMGSSR